MAGGPPSAAVVGLAEQAARLERLAVRADFAAGVSWSTIGDRLGCSEHSARRRARAAVRAGRVENEVGELR
jgi:hypothetical protein